MSKGPHKPAAAPAAETLVGENRKARFRYEILERYEAGLVLQGTEVKALRQGHLSLDEAYARFFGDELWLRDPDACCAMRKTTPLRTALRSGQSVEIVIKSFKYTPS